VRAADRRKSRLPLTLAFCERRMKMAKKRVFISFDYDHDLDLKNLLVGQAKNEDSPFEIADFSIKEAISEDWKKKART
jgi:transcriptional regulator of nitric oxide reductase